MSGIAPPRRTVIRVRGCQDAGGRGGLHGSLSWFRLLVTTGVRREDGTTTSKTLRKATRTRINLSRNLVFFMLFIGLTLYITINELVIKALFI